MLRHVLIALDGSDFAEKALDVAQRVMGPEGKVTLVMAVQTPEPPLYIYPGADALNAIVTDAEEIRSEPGQARRYLEHVGKNLQLAGLQVDVVVGAGDPAPLIIDRAYKLGVEAIILTTHGRSGLSRLLFGSVTEEVLRDSPCPVIVVPNREQQRIEEQAEQTDPALGLDVPPLRAD
jgi:nucleotide-binding universal stress UspA family protein